MTHATDYGVPAELIADRKHREKQIAAIDAEISRHALASCGLEVGDLIESKYSGLQYRVRQCSVFVNNDAVRVSLLANRVWKSGRKAGNSAHSYSHFSASDVVKIEEPANGK